MTALAGLVTVACAVEEDLFGVLPITGDPDLQRALDHWVDQAVDTVRAVAATADEQATRLEVMLRRAPSAPPTSGPELAGPELAGPELPRSASTYPAAVPSCPATAPGARR